MGTDIHGVFQKREAGGWVDIPSKYEQDQHYQLFAVLAGVRNGFGFAGIPTGEAVQPIAERRGLPEDFELDDSGEHPMSVWMGDHSFSWLSGEEMLAWYANAPVVQKCGVVSREFYESWDGVSGPKNYCGMISGEGVVVVSAPDEKPEWTHIRITWEASLAEELAYFFDEVQRLVDLHGEIRFVFGFDS